MQNYSAVTKVFFSPLTLGWANYASKQEVKAMHHLDS